VGACVSNDTSLIYLVIYSATLYLNIELKKGYFIVKKKKSHSFSVATFRESVVSSMKCC